MLPVNHAKMLLALTINIMGTESFPVQRIAGIKITPSLNQEMYGSLWLLEGLTADCKKKDFGTQQEKIREFILRSRLYTSCHLSTVLQQLLFCAPPLLKSQEACFIDNRLKG